MATKWYYEEARSGLSIEYQQTSAGFFQLIEFQEDVKHLMELVDGVIARGCDRFVGRCRICEEDVTHTCLTNPHEPSDPCSCCWLIKTIEAKKNG